jgi:hypothetical protein
MQFLHSGDADRVDALNEHEFVFVAVGSDSALLRAAARAASNIARS